MPLIRGDELTPDLQRQVLAMYVHRHTIEHPFPRAAFSTARLPVAPPTVSDAEWLRAHAFYVTRRGQLLDARRQHCEPAIIADAEVNS